MEKLLHGVVLTGCGPSSNPASPHIPFHHPSTNPLHPSMPPPQSSSLPDAKKLTFSPIIIRSYATRSFDCKEFKNN
jgi:hypothetical protein